MSDLKKIRESGHFDADWYLKTYPDVAALGMDPAEHYLKYGKLLGRSQRANDTMVETQSDKKVALPEPPNSEVSAKTAELVSIIIPSYNNGKYLKYAIRSALEQIGVDVEVIIVDDGSTDHSLQIARAEAANDNRVRVIPLLRNFGCYYARNIGIQHAKGAYICFLDSDDVYLPEKVFKQVERIKKKPSLVAVATYFQRWDEEFARALSEPRIGEVTILVKAEVFKKIGYFDSVKFGGDSEFRERLESVYKKGLSTIPTNLYKARIVESSLTMSGKGKLYELDENKNLRRTSAEVRLTYEQNYLAWHKSAKERKVTPFMHFPLLDRPFDLPNDSQNASPSLNQKRIGSMASFPPRLPNLKQAVESLLPQLDELHIYLNGYAEVPEFLNDQKITTYLGKDCAGDLRDNGKFFSLPNHEGYIFTLDDDINYPSDYVSKMIAQIELLNRSCVIGLHGVIFPKEKAAKFVENRTVLHFKDAHGYAFVDLIGTGTAAFHSSTLNINLSNFKTTGICDVWFAATCHRAGIPLMSVERPENWLTAQETVGVNLFTEAKSEEKSGHGHTKIYNEVLYGLLKPAPPRAYYEAQLLEKYGAEALELKHYTFFEMEAQAAQNRAAAKTHRTTIFNAEKKCLPKRRSIPHLHVIVNGWNCVGFVNDCLKSLRDQDAGAYTLEISAVDDGSTDGTLEALLDFGQLPNMRVFTNNKNYGPAFSRHQAIKEITDPDTVVILLDLDDWLKPDALKTIASAYRNNTKCLMTCGNWHNQHGKMNPLDFYTAEQIDNNLHRKMQKFHAAPLRTFRRKLYDAIEVTDLKGPHGEWLQTCTDVAIMLPLLDQCKSQNVQFIKKPLYVYNEKHGLGTLVRFGKPYKEERLQWIKSKEPKHLI